MKNTMILKTVYRKIYCNTWLHFCKYRNDFTTYTHIALYFKQYIYVCVCVIIIIFTLEFFTSANADGLSLKFEWQQVSSSLQDSSQYSSHSQ